jgi:hypothetical protein
VFLSLRGFARGCFVMGFRAHRFGLGALCGGAAQEKTEERCCDEQRSVSHCLICHVVTSKREGMCNKGAKAAPDVFPTKSLKPQP